MKKQISMLLLGMAAMSVPALAQEPLKTPALSPKATIKQDFSTSFIEINYSRPSARGRKVFTDVVNYGEVWRTGANAATKVTFGEDVIIAGKTVKAGSYALYTIPEKDQWEIILNEGTSNWGVSGYDKEDDVVRVAVKTQQLREPVNTFTINIANITFNSCDIELSWDKTRVALPVRADNEARITAAIDKAINQPSIPYNQAASYYLETGKNLDLAMKYADKAIEQNPQAFWLYYLKARIAAKLGNSEEAINSAVKAMELAKGSAYEQEYTRNANLLIKSVRK
jgi:tetratricopeptide (TPR) repeat protein